MICLLALIADEFTVIIINENFLSAHPFYASDFQLGTHVTSPKEHSKMYCISCVVMETR